MVLGSLGKQLWFAQLDLFQAFDKTDEAFGLGLEAGEDFRVGEPSALVEQLIDLGKEDPFGEQVAVAITEDHLQLFDRPQRAPRARTQADETNRARIEALRELQHVDEIFQDAGHAAVVFGGDDYEAGSLEDAVG